MFAKKIFTLSLVLASMGFAQETTIEAAVSPKVSRSENQTVEGIILVDGGTPLDEIKQEHGISVFLTGDDYSDLQIRLEQLLNCPLDTSFIKKTKAEIISYFRETKQQYVFVMVPAQEVLQGIVVFQIIEGRIGEIEFIGQKWFSPRVIKRSIGAQEGDPLSEEALLNDISWANKNPFRSTQLVLSKGDQKGLANLEFVTKDRFPARFYVGSDNTGMQSNNQVRVFGGGTWGNAFLVGDLLSYQYTASPDFHDFQSHVVNYSTFLPWKHLLTVFGCYGNVNPTISSFTSSGKAIQASARYEVPILPLYGDFRSHYEGGFDYKLLNSNLLFAGDVEQEDVTSTGYITVTQFLASYALQKNWEQSLLNFRTDCYFSVWQDWLPHQTLADYARLRESSHVRYAYWKALLLYQRKTESKWTLSARLRGQLATWTLPTSEQFSLGGADTVRGYYEAQFVADNAVCCNGELYTPTFPILPGFRNQMSFLLFADYGYGYNYSAVAAEYIKQNLLGIGLGLRYDIIPYMNLKADYGFQVFGIPQDHRFGRFHLSLVVSY